MIFGIHRPDALAHRSVRGIDAWGVLLTSAVERLRARDDLGPMATAVCSRLAISSFLLARVLRSSVTVGVSGDGYLGAAWARSSYWGVKALGTDNRLLELLLHLEKLDVEAAVGAYGLFEVRSRAGLHGVQLGMGGIGGETADFLQVALGRQALVLISELLGPEGVRGAGGVLVTAKRAFSDAEADQLEGNLARFGYLSDRFRNNVPPRQWLDALLANV